MGSEMCIRDSNGVDGGSTEGIFAYMQNVLVTSVVPSEGAVMGGTSVVLRVSGLTATSDGVRCLFGQATVHGVMRENGSVECVSPSSKVAGKVTLKLEGYNGGAAFTYFEAPTVALIRPSRGSLVGGASATLTGSNLAGSLVQCRFGTTVVDGTSVRVVSSTAVVCFSPLMATAGTVGVEVSVNGGADYTSDGREYLYQAGATVTRMHPSRGLAGEDGQVVTVVGENFEQTGELSCRFGLNGTVRGLFMSSTLIACTAPSRGAGTVQVSVTLNGAESSEACAV